jgi:hypothetical protein
MRLFTHTMQSGERVVRMGRERHGKTLVKGGRKQTTRRGLEYSRQGLPKIYPSHKQKVSEELRQMFASEK